MTKSKSYEFVYVCGFCKVKGFYSVDVEWVRCWRCKHKAKQVKLDLKLRKNDTCIRCGDNILIPRDEHLSKVLRICQPCTMATQHQTYIELSQIEWIVEKKLWPVVYFLQPLQGGTIKIGFTNTFYKRFNQIQAHSPLILNVVLMLDGTKRLEELLHSRFRSHRLHYEWFEDHQDILDFVDLHNSLRQRGKFNDMVVKAITRRAEIRI